MALEPVQALLADHPALRECLQSRGFQRTSASEYSNGRATVRFEGPTIIAVPGDGSRSWRTDLASVPPEAVAGVLDAILVTPPFLSQPELDRMVEQAHVAKIALDRVVDVIREAPETHSGRELRRFVWTLFNGHHVVNLWRLKGVLDSQRNGWVTEIFTAWMRGQVPDDFLRRALTDSGEMERWDAGRINSVERGRLDEALDAVDEILRTTPPGTTHTALARVSGLLRQVGEESGSA